MLLSVVVNEIHGNMPVSYVKLKGLDGNAVYKDEESGLCYQGAALMEAGIPVISSLGEYNSYQVALIKKKG